MISPIHLLERHYKNKYHLNYQHAKKLFAFDMALLLSAILLFSATIFWFTYNPTITKLIYLSIDAPKTRAISGDYVTYTIAYENKSDVKITSPSLTINLPAGFIIDTAVPAALFNLAERKFALANLPPKQRGTVTISGWFYGTPDIENKITAVLEYTQEGKTSKEIKSTPLFQFQRGSVLEANINAPDKLVAAGTTPIKIILTNNGKRALDSISISLALPAGLSFTEFKPEKGTVENNTWQIEELKPDEAAAISAILKTNFSEQIKIAAIKLTPSLKINNTQIAQNTVERKFTILHPSISEQTTWTGKINAAKPGQTLELNLSLTNNGDTALNTLEINIPIDNSIINASKLANLNNGNYQNKTFTINPKNNAGLLAMAKNQTKNLTIYIPILNAPTGGTDLVLRLEPNLEAQIPNLTDAAYQTKLAVPEIKIGTRLDLTGEVRYFTADGDQLGRGPLPPQVGKKTKYWAVLQIANTTSKTTDLVLTAQLPDYVSWTNKSSVSHGSDVNFNEKTKTVSWSLNSLAPQQNVGIYFELALMPTLAQVGSEPIILKNIKLNATDDFIKEKIAGVLLDLDVSLEHDAIGKSKGTKVE